MMYNLSFAQIYDIKLFLDQCPTNDPAIDTILNDFEIRLNGQIVTEFPCYEPVYSMKTEDYLNPLIYLQTLRVIYYMDRHKRNHLPWTDTTLYVWMKNNIDGINIVDGVIGGYCCSEIDGKIFFVTGNADDFNREFDKGWRGISGNIDFFAHEVRHTNGYGYYHSSCCGIPGGCDENYDENDLGAYGIQYWLNKAWLNGLINVGIRTSGTITEINDAINWHLSSLNSSRTRFCNNIPEIVNKTDFDYPLGPGTTEIAQSICAENTYKFAENELNEEGTYFEIFATEAGYDSAVILNLTVHELPNPDFTPNADTLTSINTYTSYQWYNQNGIIEGATSNQYIIEKSGTYYFEVTNENGCSAMSNSMNLIKAGVNELNDNQLKLLIIPNPNKGKFILRFENSKVGKYQVQILNELGQINIEKEIYLSSNVYEEEFNLSHLLAGTYFIKVFNAELVQTKKIMLR